MSDAYGYAKKREEVSEERKWELLQGRETAKREEETKEERGGEGEIDRTAVLLGWGVFSLALLVLLGIFESKGK